MDAKAKAGDELKRELEVQRDYASMLIEATKRLDINAGSREVAKAPRLDRGWLRRNCDGR